MITLIKTVHFNETITLPIRSDGRLCIAHVFPINFLHLYCFQLSLCIIYIVEKGYHTLFFIFAHNPRCISVIDYCWHTFTFVVEYLYFVIADKYRM